MLELRLKRSPAQCYSSFCDAAQLRLWLPALKKLRVATTDPQGRRREVVFELGDSLSFALVYAYDDAARRVRWVPSSGVQDGVSGTAVFEPDGEGTRFVYSLDSLRGREPGHERNVAEAFARWVNEE
jgi:hypothetical protein